MKITRAITAGGAAALMLALSACGSDETNEDQLGSEDLEATLPEAHEGNMTLDGPVSDASCDGPLEKSELAEQTCTYTVEGGEEYETTAVWLGGDEVGFTWHEETDEDVPTEETSPQPVQEN